MNKKINLKNILKENVNLCNILNDYTSKLPIQDIIMGVDETAFESKQFLYFLLNNYNRSMVFLDYSKSKNKLITTHDYTNELPKYQELETIYIYQTKLSNITIQDLIIGLLSILKIGGSIIIEFTYTNDFMDKVVFDYKSQEIIQLVPPYSKKQTIFYINNEPDKKIKNLTNSIVLIKDYYKVDVDIIPTPLFVTIKKSIWLKIKKVS